MIDMTTEEIRIFNILSRKLCDEFLKDDRCEYCPFYQWDSYFNCFNQDNYKYPMSEGYDLEGDADE